MEACIEADVGTSLRVRIERTQFDLHVRGTIPSCLRGSLVVATSRRYKDRLSFSRWHDSQADLLKLDLVPGRPGAVSATFVAVTPGEVVKAASSASYEYQPNHGLNAFQGSVWATNLLFGAPLELDLDSWQPRRIVKLLETTEQCPQVSSTSHFASTRDGRYAFFHQSLLERPTAHAPARSKALTMIRLDLSRKTTRTWAIVPPAEDAELESANFHSAFCYEVGGRQHVGLLKTGAIIESFSGLAASKVSTVHTMTPSTIWTVQIDDAKQSLQARLLPEVQEIGGFALSHLTLGEAVDDGFTLYANYKQAAVAESTRGANLYGESPEEVPEHYAGLGVEPFNVGRVIRYEYHEGSDPSVVSFSRPYSPGETSLGHSWLPINLELDGHQERLFCSFAGFRPRLLSECIARAYLEHVADIARQGFIPPLLIRLNAADLSPDADSKRRHISYAESIAFTVVHGDRKDYVCTFAPDVGLRIYEADDLSTMIATGISAELMTWRDSHFRPTPAHMQFVPS